MKNIFEQFRAFAAKKPREEVFDYYNIGECAIAQFAKSLGFDNAVADCQDIVMLGEDDRRIRVLPVALPVLFWTTGDSDGACLSRSTSWGSLSDALTRYAELPA